MHRFLACLLLGATLTACAPGPAAADPPPPSQPPAALASTPAPVVTPASLGLAVATATPAPALTPAPTSPPTPCAERRGRLSSLAVPSPTLRYAIDARVYTPPCYAASQARYPVLYLLHGLNFTEDQWERLGAASTADTLIALGEIAPLIMVMPRDRQDPRLDPAFVDDLVPYVDAHYRTLPWREYRALGGLSRGAGWSIHLGLRYPQVFGRVGAHSPAVFYGDENNVLAYARAIARDGPVPALYVDIGEGDANRQSAFWLDQVFTWFEFGHHYHLQPGAHTEAYWSAHVDDYLRFYAAAWLGPVLPTEAAPHVD